MGLRSRECDVVSLFVVCFSVDGSVCLVCCVFVNCLVKQFSICLGVVVILLLNVMEVFSVGGGVCGVVCVDGGVCDVVGGGVSGDVRVIPVIPVCI